MATGTVIQSFSYITYAAAFVPPERDAEPAIDPVLVAIALVAAPLVFVSVSLISRGQDTLRKTSIAMAWLVVIGLVLGLLSPLVGAAAGFGVGFALTLNAPGFEGQLRRRLVGVGLVVVYMAVLLIFIPPAGVLAGALLPGLIVGFADEYGAWRESKLG